MDKEVTFGRLLTILIILAIPFSYWGLTMTFRVNALEEETKIISKKVLISIDSVSESLDRIERRMSESDTLNHHTHK